MPDRNSYEYFVVRVVPFVEREEFINVGVALHCKTLGYLGIKLDRSLSRLKTFAPTLNFETVRDHLTVMQKVADGGSIAGYFKEASKSERFNWLAAKSSTIIQVSPVHSGICNKPHLVLEDLYKKMVD